MKVRLKIGLISLILISCCFAETIPRPEYPRPQFRRESWINLNGRWTYKFDFSNSGKDRNFQESKGFENEILVPFCPESKLSGVEYKDFILAMWYHRKINIPENWDNKNVILNFGGVDYKCEAYIDGEPVGKHWGGMAGFGFDISNYVEPGQKHDLVVYVYDNNRSGTQSGGKQSIQYHSWECYYTRTTGIWQTVWMESINKHGLKSCHIVPDLDGSRFIFSPKFYAEKRDYKLKIKVKENSKLVASKKVSATNLNSCILNIKEPKLWSVDNPFLYDVVYEVLDARGKVIDRVESYAGMRKIHVEGNRIFLNNEPIFLRFVLDQGFYPQGIWTAPTDAALKKDILLAKKAGFNGARLHQKVFEPRFHYWADKLGYLTWAESSSWGSKKYDPVSARNFLSQWREVVTRDRNHPSIISWTIFNESGWTYLERDIDIRNWNLFIKEQHNRFLTDAVKLTKDLDPTRPINDASGHVHVMTDLWTVHNYSQDPGKLKADLTPDENGVKRDQPEKDCQYDGQPYLVDEYGGIKWAENENRDNAGESWGYGDNPKTVEEFYDRLESLTDVILSFDFISGYTYTQLTDIEQEQNGIYYYDRSKKFDMKKIRKIFTKVPDRYKK